MKNRDFREIQVSSTLLVAIFLGVLALGVFIFLLGVSVGKKQGTVSSPTQVVTQQIPEPVKEPPVKPTASETESDPQALAAASGRSQGLPEAPASKPQAKDQAKVPPATDTAAPKTAAETKKTPAPAPGGQYYVQIAAFAERSQAQAQADKCRKLGFTAVVTDPRPSETTPRYRVRLGGYSTRDRALEVLKKYKAAVGNKTDAYVLKD
jgi:cell division protein FtsN